MSDEQPSRNELAENRTILANERTVASWMRTSLGCVAIGLGFQGLFPSMEPAWVPRAIASGFLVLAMLVIILAERRAAAVLRRRLTGALTLEALVVLTALGRRGLRGRTSDGLSFRLSTLMLAGIALGALAVLYQGMPALL